jgi:hypothetical protein
MDPERALQGALLARLRADAGVAAVVGARVWDEPPAEAAWPHLLFTRAETRPVRAEGCGHEHRLTLTVVSRYGGSEEAKAAVGAVRACLDGAAVVLAGGWRCVDLRVTYADVFRASDLRRTYGVVRLRAVTESA